MGATLRTGELNEDVVGRNTVSDNICTDYFSFDIFNARHFPRYSLNVTLLGWESLEPTGGNEDNGLSGFLSLTRIF